MVPSEVDLPRGAARRYPAVHEELLERQQMHPLQNLLVFAGLLAGIVPSPLGVEQDPVNVEAPRVLLFSKTVAYRHESIEDGIKAITALGQEHAFKVVHTEDAAQFSDSTLALFDVVVFLSTTGDVLDDVQQAAFEKYIRDGGGYVGIHAAADTEYDWPWYGGLVGAWFNGHPELQTAVFCVEDHDHPATRHLPERWTRTDEEYNFKRNPREAIGDLRVLLTVDESTYEGGAHGDDHPIAWCREFDGGRAFYTALGHTKESFAEKEFLEHILGGIAWAGGFAVEQKPRNALTERR